MTGQEAADRARHATHDNALYRDCRLCIWQAAVAGLDLRLLWPEVGGKS